MTMPFSVHHLLIDPAPSRIDDVGTDGNVRGDVAVLDRSRLDQQPGRVADGGDDFAGFYEGFDDPKALSLTQLVGIHHAAR